MTMSIIDAATILRPTQTTEQVVAAVEQRYHTLDTPQAAAAFGAQIENLCQSTQPKRRVPALYLQSTVLVGLALVALAEPFI